MVTTQTPQNEPRCRNSDGDPICDSCSCTILDGVGRDYAGKRMCSGCLDMYEERAA